MKLGGGNESIAQLYQSKQIRCLKRWGGGRETKHLRGGTELQGGGGGLRLPWGAVGSGRKKKQGTSLGKGYGELGKGKNAKNGKQEHTVKGNWYGSQTGRARNVLTGRSQKPS